MALDRRYDKSPVRRGKGNWRRRVQRALDYHEAMSKPTVWVALRVALPPELLGVFSSEARAAAACRRPNDCIGPLVLDEAAPDEASPWAGAYYPRQTQSETCDDADLSPAPTPFPPSVEPTGLGPL